MKATHIGKSSDTRVAAQLITAGVALAAAAGAFAQSLEGETPLKPGQTIERTIDGGAGQSFTLNLVTGEFVYVRVEQRASDLELVLEDVDHRVLAQRNRPGTTVGPEALSFVAESRGLHRLLVRSLEPTGRVGSYSIAVMSAESPTPQQRTQVEAERITELGHRSLAAGRIADAKQRYGEALALWKLSGARESEALTVLQLAEAHLSSGDIAAAAPLAASALEIFEALGDDLHRAISLNTLANLELSRGEPRPALGYGLRALVITQNSRSAHEEWSALTNVTAAYWMLGDRDNEQHYGERALTAARTLDDARTLASALDTRAVSMFTSGKYQDALALSRESLQLYKAMSDRGRQSRALNTIGEIYREAGRLREALEYHREALALRRPSGSKDLIAQSLNNLSLVYRALRDFDAARTHIEEALELRRQANNRRGEAIALQNLGVLLYAELLDHDKGMEALQRALTIDEEIGFASGELSVRVHLGRLHALKGDDTAAALHFARARELSHRVNDGSYEIDSLRGLAAIEWRRGDAVAARARMDEALSVFDRVVDGVVGDELRSGYFASNAAVFEQYVDFLMQEHNSNPLRGYDLEALALVEQGRARGLLRLLAEAKVNLRKDVAPELVAEVQQAQRRVDALAAQGSTTKSDPSGADSIARDLNAALTELQELRTRARASSPRFSALTNPKPLAAREIQEEALEPGTLLLEYTLGVARSFVWAVTTDRIESAPLPARAEIEPLVRRAHLLIQARNAAAAGESAAARLRRLARSERELAAVAARLSDMLLRPVAVPLREAKRVVIAADEQLAFVPFAALPRPGTNQPLIATVEIAGVPSASAIAMIRRARTNRTAPTKTLPVFADPVFNAGDPRVALQQPSKRSSRGSGSVERSGEELGPDWTRAAARGTDDPLPRLRHTRSEAEAILALVPPDQRIRALDFGATRSALESSDVANVRFLDLATHGFVNGEYPELSGIVLSMVEEGGRPVDGFVRLNHIYNLELNADLVVLSACQTALGTQVRGEGLVGVTRGLMYAGAAGVVASLWQVDDQATAALMKAFYEGLLGPRRLSPGAALREAQELLRRGRRWQSPYYWAAFTLQGEWRGR